MSLSWTLFFLCTMFNMIIMLNLLISIISDSYAHISANIKSAAYQEKASMIYENTFMIPKSRKDAFCEPNKFLVVAKDVSGEISKDDDEFAEALEGVKKTILLSQRKMVKDIEKKIINSEKNMLGKMSLMLGEEHLKPDELGYTSVRQSMKASRPDLEGDDEQLQGDIDGQVKGLNTLMRQAI